MQYWIVVLATALFMGGSLARAGTWVDVSIVNRDHHRTLETYRHRGKTYVAGRPGDYYAMRIANHSGERLLVVPSVDGVNVITGQTASPEQSGYVLKPWASTEITGWRKSTDEVAGFYFTRLSDSYAARTDRPANVGVIGVAVFREYREPPPPVLVAPTPRYQPPSSAGTSTPPGLLDRLEAGSDAASDSTALGSARSRPAAESAGGEQQPMPDPERIGTGHGEREYARVNYTSFRRAGSRPAEVVSIYYDSYENLLAQGIIPDRPYSNGPRPFPGGFVPDPPR